MVYYLWDWRGRKLTLSLERGLQLDAPFSLGAVHLEHGNSHDEDDERRNELENT